MQESHKQSQLRFGNILLNMTDNKIGHGSSPTPVQSAHSLKSKLVITRFLVVLCLLFLLPHFAEPRRRQKQTVVGVGVNAIKIGVLYRWGILRQKSSRSGGGDWVRFGGGFKGGEGEK